MELIYLISALLLGLTLHEFAHAAMSDYLGDTTARGQGRLTLNPLAHIDPLLTLVLPVVLILSGSPIIFGAAKPVPFNPWAVRGGKYGAALVAAAGPLTNFLLALVCAAWLKLVPISSPDFLVAMISVNVAFGVFNLIPFPPLDGSRILYAFVPLGVRSVMDKIERAGLAAVFIFLLIGYPLISPYFEAIIRWIMQVLLPVGML